VNQSVNMSAYIGAATINGKEVALALE